MTQQIRAFMVHTSTETLLTGGHSIHRVEFEGNVFLGWALIGLHRREHSLTQHADPCFNGAHAFVTQHAFNGFTGYI